MLAERIYGVGPLTALALTCWPGGAGRFSSARKAVRFVGLDITGSRPRLLRAGQGPQEGKRAALSEARKIIRRACHILNDLGDDAFAAA